MPEAGVARDFTGLNKGKPETNLGPNEAAEAKGVYFGNQSVEKRLGSTRLSPWSIPKAAANFTLFTYRQSPPISWAAYSGLGHRLGASFSMEVGGQFHASLNTTTYCIAQRGFAESSGALGWSLNFNEPNRTFLLSCILSAGTDIAVLGTWTNYAPNKPFHLAIRRSLGSCWMWLKDNEFEGQIGVQTGLTDAAVEKTQVNPYPMCFGTGVDPADSALVCHLDARLQEFRTWDYCRSTTSVQAYALKELPAYAVATDSLKFYYKLNEGTGQAAYDYGQIARSVYSTMTNAFAAYFMPSPPTWTTGLVTGGVGDRAVELDGQDDYLGFLPFNDEFATLRTGTSDWTVQFNTKPLDEIQNNAVLLMYGPPSFVTGTTGLAFRVKTAIDKAANTAQFQADFGFALETASLLWAASFTHSVSYGITLQRTQDQVRLRVDNLTTGVAGTFMTTGISSPSSPAFGQYVPLLAGAQYETSGPPISNFAHCVIDEIRIFKGIAWYPQDVHYADGANPNLLAYWKLNEGSSTVLNDSGPSRVFGYAVPMTTYTSWEGGFVTPIEGPEVTGLFYYQRNSALISMDDARERSFLVCAGNSIYRSEGGRWSEVETGKTANCLYTGAQVENQMVLCNGVDNNRLYDGDYMWSCGLEPPKDAPKVQTSVLASGTWDTQTTGGSLATVAMGRSGYTCRDAAQTAPGYSLNGLPVYHYTYFSGSTTITYSTLSTRVEKYFLDRTIQNVMVMPSNTSSYVFQIWHPDFTTVGMWPIKVYGMELAELGIYTVSGGTQTVVIELDANVDAKNGFRTIATHDSVTGLVGVPSPGNYNFVRFNGHFIWDTAATDTIYGSTTYAVAQIDAAIYGDYHYCYTNYNKYTGIESNPSPASDVVSPNGAGVLVTLGTTTNTSATDRFVYRTLRDGSRFGEDYFLLGTATGTGLVDYLDVTPEGYEGRLISFYRDVPPKAAICKAFKGRVWYVSVTEPNQIYFSAPYKPAEVDPYNYLVFGDSNDHITALGIWEDNLVVWKRRSTWMVPRTDIPVGVAPVRISDSIGCVSHHSVVEGNGELFFLGEDGVYSLQGSNIRRISSEKMQYYVRRLDPERLHKAVGSHLRQEGVYRLNVSPYSLYAGTSRSGKNSWMLDFHYQRSRDHVPFYESIWSWDAREASFYGEYVAETGMSYNAYGDYRGFVYLDAIQENYTDGLGWYRGAGSVWSTVTAPAGSVALTAYTITCSGSLYTTGHGLKGLPIHIRDGTHSETHICYENSATAIVLQTPTAYAYTTSAVVFVAPICSRYRSGWIDFGSTLKDKKVVWLKVDHADEGTHSTMTVGIYGGRGTTISNQTLQTHSISLSEVNEKLEARVRGKHVQLEFQHDWPGERFELYGWEFFLEGGRDR